MIKRIIKVLCSFTAALLLLFIISAPIFAASIDTAKSGSLTVSLTDNSDERVPVTGAVFVIYKVADISSSGEISLTEDFLHAGVSSDKLFDEGIAEHLSLYAATHAVEGIIMDCGEKSFVTFSDLSVGIYAVAQDNSLYDYLPCSPFTVSVPTKTAEGNIEYNINASPKVSVRRESESSLTTRVTVTKLWEGGTLRPDIKITLTRDGKPYNTIILNSSNNWTYTWDKLDIKYSWFAVEADVPEGCTVGYSRNGRAVSITNHSNTPSPETTAGEEQTTKPPIINTGLLSWPIPVLAGAGIVLFAAGYAVYTRKKS